MGKETPYYLSKAEGAKLSDISAEHIASFVERTKSQQKYVFAGRDTPKQILEQLALTDGKSLRNAALMLFGKKPQEFCRNAVIKCTQYHSTESTRKIGNQQTYEGTLFEQIEAAVDFVLSKIDRRVGGREAGPIAEGKPEIPVFAISELITNAVVHRDYDSSGSVQVTIFTDRVEIMNPGELPEKLTVDDLAKRHLSLPINPFLARPFYLAGFIEQIGRGTRDVIRHCIESKLPKPTFQSSYHQFTAILWRDIFTDELLDTLGVSERQKRGIWRVKTHGQITNSVYQERAEVTRKTATRDLDDLVEKGIFKLVGEKRGAHYVLASEHPYRRQD